MTIWYQMFCVISSDSALMYKHTLLKTGGGGGSLPAAFICFTDF